jgi:hypothetical protein
MSWRLAPSCSLSRTMTRALEAGPASLPTSSPLGNQPACSFCTASDLLCLLTIFSFALIAYESLGNETRPSSVGIGAFLRALRDPETGLFANRQGGTTCSSLFSNDDCITMWR